MSFNSHIDAGLIAAGSWCILSVIESREFGQTSIDLDRQSLV